MLLTDERMTAAITKSTPITTTPTVTQLQTTPALTMPWPGNRPPEFWISRFAPGAKAKAVSAFGPSFSATGHILSYCYPYSRSWSRTIRIAR